MYLELHGNPMDNDLQTYPSVHLTSPHEWDPSILDYEHPLKTIKLLPSVDTYHFMGGPANCAI